VQGIPIRSRQIVAQLLEQLPSLLGDDVGVLFGRLEEGLASDTGSIFNQPPCCRDSQRALGLRRGEAAPALLASLRGACEALAGTAPVAPGSAVPGGRKQVLRLVDDDTVEEEGALAAISRRHAARASLPLLLLGQRFGVLFARPPLSAEALPLGPTAFCAALAEASERIGLCSHARLALYRLYDVEFAERYPTFAEALDAWVDDAGILRGLAYVPLRRGAPMATAVARASEQDALQSVSRAAEALGPEAALPARMQTERREALVAMTQFLMRHGRDSSQWSECINAADSLLEAARNTGIAPEEVAAWLRKAFASIGYGTGDATRLAAGLTTPLADGMAGARAAGDEATAAGEQAPVERQRGVREQRCFDRLLLLPPGAQIGFSAGTGGFLHAALREHHPDPARLLLAVTGDGPEIMFEADMLARLLAAGQAWIMRQPAAMAQAATA
jgi:hypothetical protein